MKEFGITQERALESYRPRLVRLCSRLTGSAEGAEELAQETMIEAWRNWHKLERGEVSFAWLSRIAQFVVRRWWRRRERVRHREQELTELDAEFLAAPEGGGLEHEELLMLFDRAMAKLPERTRTLLRRSCVEGQSLQEIAERDKITPSNAAVRLWRGRSALQSVVQTHFPEEALAYGLFHKEDILWRETPVWCGNCGQRRLLVHQDNQQVVFRCPQCHPDPDPETSLVFLRSELPPGPIPGYRVLLRRLSKHIADTYLPAVERGEMSCSHCKCPIRIEHHTPMSKYPTLRDRYGLSAMCPTCKVSSFAATLGRLYMAQPEVQRFWSQHNRIRRSTEEDIQYAGIPAIRIPFESKLSSAQLSVIVRRDNFQLLRVE